LTVSVIIPVVIGAVLLATRRAARESALPAITVKTPESMKAGTQAPPPEASMSGSATTTMVEVGTLDVAVPPLQTAQPTKQEPKVITRTNGVPPAAAANTGSRKQPLKDPMARVALFFVGDDPDAEAYWHEAINDTSLSAHERQDLIEDLNEDGLSDPKHPTEDDLPLIINRLLIIEEIRPEAVDQVNADAFQEAYKDLVNLAEVAMGGGRPVR